MAQLRIRRAEKRAEDRRPWGRRGTTGASIATGISFASVSHDYGGVVALTGIDLDVAPGEILCLLGRSGCGKTTLLRIAAGLERQTGGRVLLDGREIAGPNVFLAPEKRGIGLMFQDYALFPHLSILANVMFGLTGLPHAEAEREARRMLARVGLDGFAEEYPHALSGGEQQRVALARAVVPRPGILLMDEPFSGLDRRLRESVREETLAIIRETRATCVVVTHDPEEAMRLGDRIALLREGRIVQIGAARELYERPVDLAAARFFSDIMEFDGLVGPAGTVASPLGPLPAAGRGEGCPVTIGVRPQGIRLMPAGSGVPGLVVGKHFLGEVEALEIAVEGRDAPIRARVRDASGVRVGSEVGLSADDRDVLVFAKRDD